MTTRHITRMAAAILLAVSTAQGATIFVNDDNCPGPGSGIMGDPYCSIQTAIDNAVDTDEVVVSPGTYFEAISFLGKAITLRSIDPNDPDVVAATIIDGTGNFHVVQCVTGEGPDTVLDGFTITGGNANGPWPDSAGGGMFNDGGTSPTVTNCTFRGNTADNSGGGMFNFGGNSSPTVTNCTFSENAAMFGGGMRDFALTTITNCTFSGNTALDGGGMYNGSSFVTLTNCLFSENSAEGRGGGMYILNSPTLTDSTFSGNTSGGFGGGIYVVDGSPTLTGCKFSENTASQGGGLDIHPTSSATVTNSMFCDNLPRDIHGPVDLQNISTCPNPCPADVDGDGTVGITDFLDVLAAWGACP